MVITTLGNIKGPKGDRGERGPKGLPGMNAAPTDAAVAGLIGTPGDSESKAAVVDLAVWQGSVVNAAQFGLVPGESVDGAPAIQTAIDTAAALGIRTVLIPPGDFGASGIRLRDRTYLSGYGATLHRLPGTGMVVMNWEEGDTTTVGYEGASDIVVEGLAFDGHGDTILENLNTVTFQHCRNIIVRDCVFRRSRGYHALELNAVDNALVHNCRFEGFVAVAGLTLKEAIQIDCATSMVNAGAPDGTMTRDVVVQGCVFTGYGELPPHHVAVGAHATVAGAFYDNISVLDCRMEGMTGRGVAAYYWRGGEIRGNFMSVPVSSFGVRAQECYGLTISGNFIVGPGAGAATQGISVSINSKVCRVVGNHVENINEGIYAGSGTLGVLIASNTIRETGSYAIVADSSNDVEITGNNVFGAGYPAGAFGAIRITGTSNAASITGNKVRPHGAGTEVMAAISVAATAPSAWGFGNDFFGMPAASAGAINTTSNRT